ncbi:large ribosomal subunit protein mL63-like [Glandiceps talaboti]
MWLTRFLMAHRPLGRRVPGLQWTGKKRRPRIITKFMIRNMERRLERELENDLLLSRPFLTVEEQVEEQKLTNQREAEEYAKIKASTRRMRDHKKMEDLLGHLNVTKKWENDF